MITGGVTALGGLFYDITSFALYRKYITANNETDAISTRTAYINFTMNKAFLYTRNILFSTGGGILIGGIGLTIFSFIRQRYKLKKNDKISFYFSTNSIYAEMKYKF